MRFSARPAGQTIRRRPVRASLSSGATAEYDRSRQSLDSSVRSLARSTLSDLPAQGFGPLSATRSPTLGKPRAGVRPEGRSTGAAPSASDGDDLRRGCPPRTDGGDHVSIPKVRVGPPRANALDRSRGASLPSALGSTMASHHRHTREPAAACLSRATRRNYGRSFVSSAASLRPCSPKKASRRITFPVGCDSDRGV